MTFYERAPGGKNPLEELSVGSIRLVERTVKDTDSGRAEPVNIYAVVKTPDILKLRSITPGFGELKEEQILEGVEVNKRKLITEKVDTHNGGYTISWKKDR